MANNVTYANALVSIRDFAVDNGFDNNEVIEKINKLIDQKTKTHAANGKSKARKANEKLAKEVAKVATDNNNFEIDNKWIRNNINGITSPARATAVMNAAVDMGLFERHIHTKSATRNTITYTLC